MDHLHHMEPALAASGALLLGFLGGLGHCTLMCGGILFGFDRLAGGLRWPQTLALHAGRIGMYTILALLVAGLGTAVLGPAHPLRLFWGAFLGVILLGVGVSLAAPGVGVRLPGAGGFGRWLGARSRRLLRHGLGGTLAAGFGWGLMPCIFSWGAIAAAGSQPPAAAAAAIGAFGLGTAGALGAIHVAGQQIRPALALRLRRPSGVLLAGYGVWIVVRSLSGIMTV